MNKLDDIGLTDDINNITSVVSNSKTMKSIIALAIQKLVNQGRNSGIFLNVGRMVDMRKVFNS